MRANISDLWILLVNVGYGDLYLIACLFSRFSILLLLLLFFFATEIFRFLVARVKNSIRDFKFYLEESVL